MNTKSSAPPKSAAKKLSAAGDRRSMLRFFGFLGLAFLLAAGGLALLNRQNGTEASAQTARLFKPTDTPFNGDRAYGFLKDICAIGPRISATEGMVKQQELLKTHFAK